MNAYNLIPEALSDQHKAINEGLLNAGYKLQKGRPGSINNGDIVVMWNRWGENERLADRLEQSGGNLIIAENGYTGIGYVALARSQHNGGGWVPQGDCNRLDALKIDFKPYRADGDHVLVCSSRGMGSKKMAEPNTWQSQIVENLRRYTKRPIKIRPHPGNWKENHKHLTLYDDLKDAWACVIWNSGAGIRALIEGIPVIACSDYWVLKDISNKVEDIENPILFERKSAFNKLAWSQWSLDEIESGEPFLRFRLC